MSDNPETSIIEIVQQVLREGQRAMTADEITTRVVDRGYPVGHRHPTVLKKPNGFLQVVRRTLHRHDKGTTEAYPKYVRKVDGDKYELIAQAV